MLLVDRGEPRPLAVADEGGGALAHSRGEVRGHRVADPLGVAALGELLPAVLGERLELGEAQRRRRPAPR